MKINLTQEQTARFDEFVEKWTKIGLCTEPANRPAAEDAIQRAYIQAGLKPPRIVWTTSPMASALTRLIIIGIHTKEDRSVEQGVWQSVAQSVEQSAGQGIGRSVLENVDEIIRQRVQQNVWKRIRERVQLDAWMCILRIVDQSIQRGIWMRIWQIVERSVWQNINQHFILGARDPGYSEFVISHPAIYDFLRDACSLLAETEEIKPLLDLARQTNLCLFHKEICWVSERHTLLRMDQSHRLHSDHGPALAYPDGFGVWAWHGLRVPKEVIDLPVDVARIQAERNAEHRRIFLQQYGLGNYIRDTGAKKIKTDKWGVLYEIPAFNHGELPIRVVMVENSTPEPDGTRKLYTLAVPPECETPEQGLLAIHGLPMTARYRPVVEA